MKNKNSPAKACLAVALLVAGSAFAHAELEIGKSYMVHGTGTAFFCAGNPKDRPHANKIAVFRTNETDVFIYFGKDVGLKLDYKKAVSGGDNGSTTVTEGGKRYRDTGSISISGNDVILKVEALSLSNSGLFRGVWQFSANGRSCQPLSYDPEMLCGARGVNTSFKNGNATRCEVSSGPPDFK